MTNPLRAVLVLLLAACIGFLLTVLAVALAKDTARAQPVRIVFDQGGKVVDYITKYSEGRNKGTHYIIDGMCISACALIAGEVPRDHVCVTDYARLGFHAAFTEAADGSRVFSPVGTEISWFIFYPVVRQLLQEHGWNSPNVDHPDLLWIDGLELREIFKSCKEGNQ